jgi:hypothetical protein
MKKLLVMIVLAAVAGSASAALVTFDGAGSSALVDYEDAANWDPEGVAGSDDDVIVTGRFKLLNATADHTINSLTVNGTGSTVAGGKLTVTGDVAINSAMTVKNATGVFTWEGAATLGDGTGTDILELVYGTHDTKVVGNDLTVAANGRIKFNWFTAQTLDNTNADIGLTGDLTFVSGSSVLVDLNGGGIGALVDDGVYYLVRSESITGDLPTLLTDADWDEDQADNSYLSFVETGDNQGLYLTVIPEPATLGLVAAFGGTILFIRRRFMI